ncbi:MAG TPA: phosphoglycerate mutase family protein [Thermoplasmata archaeon]|nr:phosphoglycerate mutase family protein [Thermoplasmata archaeon]
MLALPRAMRTLVHLRHAEREAGGVHLTERGVRLAAEVGRRLPRFDRVLTSPKPRAVETAEAMGYRVDGELFALGSLPEELGRQLERADPRSFADYVRLVEEVVELREHAHVLAGVLEDELVHVPEGARLLVVSHGGVVELGAIGAVGRTAAPWGPAVGHLEGVELGHDSGSWSRASVIRPVR